MTRKLALYSDQIIPENRNMDQRLLYLIGKEHPQVGYIPSSRDPFRIFYNEKQNYYAEVGINLALYFEIDGDYHPELLPDLLACDAIHLSGGNTFHFLYWLRARNLLDLLCEYVSKGGVLIGTSAGAILMTPEISTTTYFNDAPLPGEDMTDLTALNLVDFAFLPHLNTLISPATLMAKYTAKNNRPVYGCPDGSGIIVNGDEVELVGNITIA